MIFKSLDTGFEYKIIDYKYTPHTNILYLVIEAENQYYENDSFSKIFG